MVLTGPGLAEVRDHPGHAGAGWALMAKLGQGIEGLAGSHGDELHPAIGEVSNPAPDAELERAVTGGGPKVHTLDLALDVRVEPLHNP